MKRTLKRKKKEEVEQIEIPVVEAKTKPHAGAIEWVNTGGKHYRPDGSVVMPGKKFWAREDEIAAGFRDIIKPLNPIPAASPLTVISRVFHLRPYNEGEFAGKFDIVDNRGKVINENPLDEENANIIMKAIQA